MSKRDRNGVKYQRRWDDRQPRAVLPVADLAALRTLSVDHHERYLHWFDTPAKRGLRCGICNALAAIADQLDTGPPIQSQDLTGR